MNKTDITEVREVPIIENGVMTGLEVKQMPKSDTTSSAGREAVGGEQLASAEKRAPPNSQTTDETKPKKKTLCWFLKDGKRLEEGIETSLRFKSAASFIHGVGLEIYDVTYNGEIIGEIYAGAPQNMKEGFGFELEEVS